MRQLMKIFATISSILWSLLSSESLMANEIHPDFCGTQNFDGVYYIGWNLTFKSGKWFWRFDRDVQRMVPSRPDPTRVTTTTLFIDHVPECALGVDCNDLKKALYLMFTRRTVVSTGKETTDVFRLRSYTGISSVAQNEYPWKLTDPHVIWPSSWNDWPNRSRASLFFPPTNMAFFVDNEGEYYTLFYQQINSVNWFRQMKANRISSGVVFVGMFFTAESSLIYSITPNLTTKKDAIYAVGHEVNDPKKASKLYYLRSDMTFDRFVSSYHSFLGCVIDICLQDMNLHRMMWCMEHEIPFTDIATEQTTSNSTPTEAQIRNPSGNGFVYIVTIITIVFICVIVIAIAILFYIKLSGKLLNVFRVVVTKVVH